MYSDHSKNQASRVNTDKLVYSVNSLGKNKDWHKKLLTNGFVDKQGSVSDLKEAIKAGHAISPAHYGGMPRNTENVIKAGLLLVDVDNGWTIEQAKADPFIQQFCLLAYTSSSHTPEHHKFRLIFALPDAVEAPTFPWLVKPLLGNFPHDPSPKSVCNAFYGNSEAIFFIENPGAILPQEWIDDAIANAQAEKEEAERKRQERQQWLKDNPPHICSDVIPLIKCCRNEVRRWIGDGVPAKSGHNNAALSVLMELLAVERYLDQIGQPYAGSAREYYDRFLVASGVDDGKAEQRWEWAEAKQNLDTSLDPEVIQRCIYAHEFSKLKTAREHDQYRKEHPDFKPLNEPRSTNQQESSQESKHQEWLDLANEAGTSLSEKLTALLGIDGNIGELLAVCGQIADDFATSGDPIAELKDWIRSFSGYTESSRRLKAIQFAAAVCHGHGDRITNLEICQLIQTACGISRVDVIQREFNEALRIIDPPIPATQRALQAIASAYGDKIKFNELAQKVELDGKEFKDAELVYLSDELEQYELSKTLATDALLVTAKKQSYHPIRDYLDSLKIVDPLNDDEWKNLASRLLGTDSELSQVVLTKSLIAAVARIYKPGCYVRTIPVLKGEQNAGKSTFLRLLAGDDFFSDSLGKDQSKDDFQLLHSYWIHEWSELDKLTNRTAGDVKAFITKTKDDYRSPYARSPETHKRQCVIFGTCNRDDFLKDATGNTRFSVIEVGNVDIELLKQWRNRIWATARAKYLDGESWELTQAEMALSELNNKDYSERDPWLEDIAEFLEYRSEVSLGEIFDHLHLEQSKRDSLSSKRIRDCLTTMGWQRDKLQSRRDGIRARRWRPMLSHLPVSLTSFVCETETPSETPSETTKILIQQEFQVDVSDVSVKNSKTFLAKNSVLGDDQPTIEVEVLGMGDFDQEKVGEIGEPSETPTPIPCTASILPVSTLVSVAETAPETKSETASAETPAKSPRPYPQTDLDMNPEAEQRLIVKQLKSAMNKTELTQVKERWNQDSVKWIYNYLLTPQEKLDIQAKAQLPLVGGAPEVNYA